MRPLTALGLLLSCAVSLSSSMLLLENELPIGWAQTMGSISEFPTQNGVVTPDPFNNLHRFSQSRLMIDSTNLLMASIGSSPADNPMWSLPLQNVWMSRSGRFADPTGATTCGKASGDENCISPESWWGCVNYFVQGLSFLSAAKSGFFGEGVEVTYQKPADATDYCATHEECTAQYPDAMAKWDAYYQGLISVGGSALPDNERKDAILGLLWSAQMASIESSSICNGRKTHYSSKEVSFAESWLSLFHYLAAVHFQSSLIDTVKFMTPLPPRVLEEDDTAPAIADMTAEENHNLVIFSWMNTINNIMGGSLVSSWKGAMCSPALREQGRDLMSQLVLDPKFQTSKFVSLVTGMSFGC